MHICIDESGNFVIPPSGKLGFSCIGAAVIPEATYGLLAVQFPKARGSHKAEVKGSQLSEREIARVIALAQRCGVRFIVAATEMSLYSQRELELYRDDQAHHLTATLTPKHNPNLIRQMTDLSQEFQSMPIQLAAQFMILTELVSRVLRTTVIHFGLHRPRELGAFHWRIDAKDHQRTAYERAWQMISGGLIQSIFLKKQFLSITEADYSDFHASFLADSQVWPSHLAEHHPIPDEKPGKIINLRKILQDSMTFEDSSGSVGLQLADILVNAYRRAVTGRLQHEGWAGLSSLMLRGQQSPLGLLHLTTAQSTPTVPNAYSNVLLELQSNSRSVLDR